MLICACFKSSLTYAYQRETIKPVINSEKIIGLTVKPDGKNEEEVDLSFTAQDLLPYICDFPDAQPLPDSAVTAAQMVFRTKIPGTEKLFFSYDIYGKKDVNKDKEYKELMLWIGQIRDIGRELDNASLHKNVNRPEISNAKIKNLMIERAALGAKFCNYFIKNFQWNMEMAEIDGRKPFESIKMSKYELWVSDKINEAKFEDKNKKIKYIKFLNRILIDRYFTSIPRNRNPVIREDEKIISFAEKTLGAKFLEDFEKGKE